MTLLTAGDSGDDLRGKNERENGMKLVRGSLMNVVVENTSPNQLSVSTHLMGLAIAFYS